MEKILEINNLHVSYGAIRALRGVNISVPKGKIVGILGANGAGKTTLLKTISGLVRSQEGEIIFQTENITRKPPEKITEIGISHVPEGRKIFGDLSVLENLLIGGFTVKSKSMPWSEIEEASKNNRLKKLYNQIKSTDENPVLLLKKNEVLSHNLALVYHTFPVLKERSKQTAATLSGGEMQMLAIARGLMGSPSLLVLDEPSLGLAPLIVKDIFEIIRVLNDKGISILIVEQNALQTLKIADYAYVLQLGKVVQEGLAEKLIQDQELIQAYLG